MANDLRKEYPLDNILYDEFYRVKLTFPYYLFSKNAIGIIAGVYFFACVMNNFSFNAFSSICFFALMVGYKNYFKSVRGEEFNIWLIKIFGDFTFFLKKKYRQLYA